MQGVPGGAGKTKRNKNMSTWHEPGKDDISFSDDGKEMHVCFDSDYSGAIYIHLKVEDVKEAIAAAEKETRKCPCLCHDLPRDAKMSHTKDCCKEPNRKNP